MDSLIENVERLLKLETDIGSKPDPIIILNKIVSLTHEICISILNCENSNIPR